MEKNYDIIVDVRGKDEFTVEHIQDSVDLPLDFIESREARVAKLLKGKRVLLMCRSGRRAELAKNILEPHTEIDSLSIFPGGILEYKKQFPNEIISGENTKNKLPIMRQVQLTAGILILLWMLGSLFVASWMIWIAVFVGAGLSFAGITGFCGMATLLSKAPWNT